MDGKQPWYRDFFNGIAMESWAAAIPAELTDREVDLIEELLDPPYEAHLLDVPCGRGRHAFPLAERGYRITGVDICAENLAANQAHADANGLHCKWTQADMACLPVLGSFDGAYCLGNSFGYTPPAETAHFLKTVRENLAPGAGFLMDTAMAAESILPSLRAHEWAHVGEIYLLIERTYVAVESRMDLTYTFIRNGTADVRHAQHWVFTTREITAMLENAGFRVLEHFVGRDRRPYHVNDVRLFVHAEAC